MKIDGVICFGGEDWWYHSQGHYDIQMMRQFARRVPVLYINSLAMRIPSLTDGRTFVVKALRKLKSMLKGLIFINEKFAVLSLLSVPGVYDRRLMRSALTAQIQRTARKMGMRRPLIWLEQPRPLKLAEALNSEVMIYQRTDRFEADPEVNAGLISQFDKLAKQTAVLTLFASKKLYEAEKDECKCPLYLDHGVDFEEFRDAGNGPLYPDDIKEIPKPRIGFIGTLEPKTFNRDLFLDVARSLPDCSFVLVGPSSMPAGWCKLTNVFLLGLKEYRQVASYMASCDVLFMMWNDNDWIEACNPVKLKEYLATGRPVITTHFPEIETYADLVKICSTAGEFTKTIVEVLSETHNPEIGRQRISRETWNSKMQQVLDKLGERGYQVDSREN